MDAVVQVAQQKEPNFVSMNRSPSFGESKWQKCFADEF